MKHIVITGSASGIGYETTRYLIDQGYFVFGNVINQLQAEKLNTEFGSEQFYPLVFDVTDEAAIEMAVDLVRQKLRGNLLCGLINNAGIAIPGPLLHIDPEDLRLQFEVNVFGVLNVTRAFLPLLGGGKDCAGSPGRIINVSSLAGIIASPFTALYSASKYALEAISDGLRRELFIYNIDVISVLPGAVNTPIWETARSCKNAYEHTDYAPYFAKINKKLDNTIRQSVEPIQVAKAVYKGLSKTRPKTRYIVDKYPWTVKLVHKFMPDRWLDALMIRGLNKLITS